MTMNADIKIAAVVTHLPGALKVLTEIGSGSHKLGDAVVPGLKEPAIVAPVQYGTADNNKNTLYCTAEIPTEVAEAWDKIIFDYRDNIQTIDLRPLDIAQAISEILGELRYLLVQTALLFVLHNRLPIPFLNKLTDNKFDYHIKVISDGEINILIFKVKYR